jgi:hypothetical protein
MTATGINTQRETRTGNAARSNTVGQQQQQQHRRSSFREQKKVGAGVKKKKWRANRTFLAGKSVVRQAKPNCKQYFSVRAISF